MGSSAYVESSTYNKEVHERLVDAFLLLSMTSLLNSRPSAMTQTNAI